MRFREAGACTGVAACLLALATGARAEAPPAAAPQAASPGAAPQAASDVEQKPPRPPLPPMPETKPLPWEQHVEIGGGVAFSEVVATTTADGKPTPVRLRPGVGGHVRLAWQLFRYLAFSGYMVEADHGLQMPSGSLGVTGTFTGPGAHSYFFGGRISPTLPIGDRVRLWATVGGGWGLVAYPAITVTAPGGAPFTIRSRTSTIVEIPVGAGASFEIIPRWLRIHAELTYSFYPSQIGDAVEIGQAVDDTGRIRNVGPMPHLDGGFTQTLGLSLIL